MKMKRMGFFLACEGLGDALYAVPVIKKIYMRYKDECLFDIFSYQPGIFKNCPYIENSYIADEVELNKYVNSHDVIRLFEIKGVPHHAADTCDFISIPLGNGTLSFRDKQLEYFPCEEDEAKYFDVVINTSETWPSRSWPAESWQKLADLITSRGFSVAVVGKDTKSEADGMMKRFRSLVGCTNLGNKLSLDQTFYTIRKCGLFITCQNGLSVLAGATDVEMLVLDMSIDWSRRAVFRNEDPHYKVGYIKGKCNVYCCAPLACPLPENNGEFKCHPGFSDVSDAVLAKLPARRGLKGYFSRLSMQSPR